MILQPLHQLLQRDQGYGNRATQKITNTTTKNNSAKTITEERTERTPIKYGVTRLITYTDTFKVYADGRKELVLTKEKSSKIDYSTFSATTNDMKDEASTIAAQNKSAYQEMLGYVNELRASVGVNPLTLDNSLSVAATVRSLEIAWSGKFDHTRPNGSKCFTVISELGISSSARGENIAGYSSNVKSTFEQWKESQGHYENMVSPNFTKIGIGKVTLNNKSYWVQLFIG